MAAQACPVKTEKPYRKYVRILTEDIARHKTPPPGQKTAASTTQKSRRSSSSQCPSITNTILETLPTVLLDKTLLKVKRQDDKNGVAVPICVAAPLFVLRDLMSKLVEKNCEGGETEITIIHATGEERNTDFEEIQRKVRLQDAVEKTDVFIRRVVRRILRLQSFEEALALLSPFSAKAALLLLGDILQFINKRSGGRPLLTLSERTTYYLLRTDWLISRGHRPLTWNVLDKKANVSIMQYKIAASKPFDYRRTVGPQMQLLQLFLLEDLTKLKKASAIVSNTMRCIMGLLTDICRIIVMGYLPGVEISTDLIWQNEGAHLRSPTALSVIIQFSYMLGFMLVNPEGFQLDSLTAKLGGCGDDVNRLLVNLQMHCMTNILCTGNGLVWESTCTPGNFLSRSLKY